MIDRLYLSYHIKPIETLRRDSLLVNKPNTKQAAVQIATAVSGLEESVQPAQTGNDLV